ncbi:hypothetical protein MBLNU230_g8469t1 [Neophaeotheca triangularis]
MPRPYEPNTIFLSPKTPNLNARVANLVALNAGVRVQIEQVDIDIALMDVRARLELSRALGAFGRCCGSGVL